MNSFLTRAWLFSRPSAGAQLEKRATNDTPKPQRGGSGTRTLLARAILGEPYGSLMKRTNEMEEARLLKLRARRGARGNVAILSE